MGEVYSVVIRLSIFKGNNRGLLKSPPLVIMSPPPAFGYLNCQESDIKSGIKAFFLPLWSLRSNILILRRKLTPFQRTQTTLNSHNSTSSYTDSSALSDWSVPKSSLEVEILVVDGEKRWRAVKGVQGGEEGGYGKSIFPYYVINYFCLNIVSVVGDLVTYGT